MTRLKIPEMTITIQNLATHQSFSLISRARSQPLPLFLNIGFCGATKHLPPICICHCWQPHILLISGKHTPYDTIIINHENCQQMQQAEEAMRRLHHRWRTSRIGHPLGHSVRLRLSSYCTFQTLLSRSF